jgi:quinol monooxygenase YgiN
MGDEMQIKRRMMKPMLVLCMILLETGAPAQTNTAVYVATYIDVQSSSLDKGTSLVRQYRDDSRMERGNSNVTAIQEIGRTNRFVIIEVWGDQSSFDAHEKAEGTARFRAALKAIHNSPFDQRVHRAFAIDSRPVSNEREIISVVTHVDVPPQRTNETEVLLRSLAEESHQDEGNMRYEVFQQAMSRNHFTVVAMWRDAKAFDSHEKKAHTRQFREALGPMLGAPYDERLYKSLR